MEGVPYMNIAQVRSCVQMAMACLIPSMKAWRPQALFTQYIHRCILLNEFT